jgi:hypothetical protein
MVWPFCVLETGNSTCNFHGYMCWVILGWVLYVVYHMFLVAHVIMLQLQFMGAAWDAMMSHANWYVIPSSCLVIGVW